jgi:hypothetical protein
MINITDLWNTIKKEKPPKDALSPEQLNQMLNPLRQSYSMMTDEQFNYMINFAIRQLNTVYYEEKNGRTPIVQLRLKIKNRLKRLNEMKK